MSVDILGTSCDQCRSMVQYSFTSTETRRLVRTDSPGRPPRLSHSSWTMLYVHRNYRFIRDESSGRPSRHPTQLQSSGQCFYLVFLSYVVAESCFNDKDINFISLKFPFDLKWPCAVDGTGPQELTNPLSTLFTFFFSFLFFGWGGVGGGC